MKNILIIEDDLSIAELQKDYLEIAGFSVEVYTDGITGLNALNSKDYDLLILDIMIPGLSGFEILKSIEHNKDIPVLLVSARKEEIDKIKGLTLGADDYITKPFSPGELVARVKSHIINYERLKNRFKNKNDHKKLVIRGLQIDSISRQVFINDTEVALAQKEFDLLLFLAQNANRVFNRECLFEKIWGLDSLGDTATVTVHIRKIREKIETTPSEPQYIETVWGAGYKFRI